MEFNELRTAIKRAKHFGNIEFSGPFSLIRTGVKDGDPRIMSLNMIMLLDAIESPYEELGEISDDIRNSISPMFMKNEKSLRFVQNLCDDLSIFHMWAKHINRICDTKKVDGDILIKNTFSVFLSRIQSTGVAEIILS